MKLDSSISAIVTGGASGLGEATARKLREHGVKVGLFDFNEERGEEIAKEIGATFAKVDVSDEASVDAGFATIRAAQGQERILVNCAGIGYPSKTARRDRETGEPSAHSMPHFRKVIDVNLIGSFMCASKSAAGMMTLDPTAPDGERGAIVHTGSVAAQDGQIGQVAYSASKGAIVGMTLPMARDLGREGIRVNTILPGFFETPIYQQMPDQVKDSLRAHVVFPQRFGHASEFASLAELLITQPYMNAEVIRMDAGARMPPK
jgi:NAD(P)-dependent dehydrogenase (short-subunit alcohol dehydrogenase family)